MLLTFVENRPVSPPLHMGVLASQQLPVIRVSGTFTYTPWLADPNETVPSTSASSILAPSPMLSGGGTMHHHGHGHGPRGKFWNSAARDQMSLNFFVWISKVRYQYYAL